MLVIGSGGGVYVEGDWSADTTFDIIICVVEAGKVGSARRQGAVDGKGAGYKTGGRYQNGGTVGGLAAVGTGYHTTVISGDKLRGAVKGGGGAGDVGPVSVIGGGLPLIGDAAGNGLSAQRQIYVLSRTGKNRVSGCGTASRRTGAGSSGRPGKCDVGASGLCAGVGGSG